jgi:predicted transcriptional regulator
MKKLPCENAIWVTLPIIRKELACCMVKDFKLTQKEAAELIGITPAAVSQYKCKKRANINIEDLTILNEIKSSTRIIIEKGKDKLNSEICRLCRLINKKEACPDLK